MIKKLYVGLLAGVLALPAFGVQEVLINEVCQSNVYCVDENMYLPDTWIELYNTTDQPIDLNGWSVEEGKKSFTRYQINPSQYMPMGSLPWRKNTSTVIPAHGYLLLYGDEANIGLHTNFKVDNGKAHILRLYDAQGKLVDTMSDIPALIAPDISYGRLVDQPEVFSHFTSSTPLAANRGAAKEQAHEVQFSQVGGLFSSPVRVALSVLDDAAGVWTDSIRYTLDGSEPTAASLRYEAPLLLDTNTVLRARVVCDTLLPALTQTQSYLFPDHPLSLPVLSIVTDSLWFFDDSLDIYEGTKTAAPSCWGESGNYVGDRDRYISIEYFTEAEEAAVLNQSAYVRISGACTRTFPKKSMVIKTNKRLLNKAFPCAFWKDKPHIEQTKSFILRSGGQDWSQSIFRDAAMQYLLTHQTDLDYQAYQPCVLYVNGGYWSIFNIRERSQEDWLPGNTPYTEDEVDMVAADGRVLWRKTEVEQAEVALPAGRVCVFRYASPAGILAYKVVHGK